MRKSKECKQTLPPRTLHISDAEGTDFRLHTSAREVIRIDGRPWLYTCCRIPGRILISQMSILPRGLNLTSASVKHQFYLIDRGRSCLFKRVAEVTSNGCKVKLVDM